MTTWRVHVKKGKPPKPRTANARFKKSSSHRVSHSGESPGATDDNARDRMIRAACVRRPHQSLDNPAVKSASDRNNPDRSRIAISSMVASRDRSSRAKEVGPKTLAYRFAAECLSRWFTQVATLAPTPLEAHRIGK